MLKQQAEEKSYNEWIEFKQSYEAANNSQVVSDRVTGAATSCSCSYQIVAIDIGGEPDSEIEFNTFQSCSPGCPFWFSAKFQPHAQCASAPDPCIVDLGSANPPTTPFIPFECDIPANSTFNARFASIILPNPNNCNTPDFHDFASLTFRIRCNENGPLDGRGCDVNAGFSFLSDEITISFGNPGELETEETAMMALIGCGCTPIQIQ